MSPQATGTRPRATPTHAPPSATGSGTRAPAISGAAGTVRTEVVVPRPAADDESDPVASGQAVGDRSEFVVSDPAVGDRSEFVA
ncbi:hypothetical protein ACWD0Z_25565, partial [Streptomyces sp. NPDC003007]